MATIRKPSPTKFRTDIRRNNTFIQSKTFPTKQQAMTWSDHVEINIKKILPLNPKQLKNHHLRKFIYWAAKRFLKTRRGTEIHYLSNVGCSIHAPVDG